MKKNQTRRALLMSALSLLLCCSMLIGTTFAWFTDEVKSGKNVIAAGNLDVELYYQAEGQTGWTEVTENTNIFMENALWEPGHTEVVKLKIVNAGSLALKYKLGVNVVSETGSVSVDGKEFQLSDYIKFGIIDGEQTYTREQAVAAIKDNETALDIAYNSEAIDLLPLTNDNTDNEDIVTMVVYMPTSVGNEANHAKGANVPTINLGLNLYAAQLQHESDSFGSDYDAGIPAIIEVTPETAQATLDALESSAIIKLAAGNYGTLVIDEGTVNEKTTTSNNMVGNDVLDMYTRKLPNLTFIGEDGAVVAGINIISQRVWETNVAIETAPAHYVRQYIDNLKFENIDFNGGGVVFSLYEGSSTCEEPDLGNIKNVTFDDCSFTGTYGIRVINNYTTDNITTYCKPVNLTVTNSTFSKIGGDVANPAEQGSTALYIQYAGDLTVSGCTFSEIQYDSIQMAHRSSGKTIITGNTFANTDGYKGYIARAMNLNGVSENAAVIENNVFYKSNSTKSNKYIKAGQPITVGVNTWYELPVDADFAKVTIDMSVQKVATP